MNAPIAPLDLMWLLIESPGSTTHVGAMMLFEKPKGRKHVVREIVDAYRDFQPVPPFTYVPDLIGSGAPHFRETSEWDPEYHVCHLSLPAGSSEDDLLRLVADLHEPMLDRDRPLFRCWIIDGVPGGRFAVYSKTHHSIVDGVSGLKMLYAGLSRTDEHSVPEPAFALHPKPTEPHPPTPLFTRAIEAVRGVVTQVEAINQITATVVRKALGAALGSELEGSLPFLADRAPTNVVLKQGRGFATMSLPLEEMHQIGHHFGATLNDVAVTVVDAGLHAYFRETGQPFPHRLTSMCPVSLRGEGDDAGGTRVSAIIVRLGEPDAGPLERLKQVVDSVAVAKKELASLSTDAAMTFAVGAVALAGVNASTHLDRVARPACNLVISNVPGSKQTRYLNGARLLGIFPVSALAASIGLNVTLSSYEDHMDFGFVADTGAVQDVSALAAHTRRAYQELKKAAAR